MSNEVSGISTIKSLTALGDGLESVRGGSIRTGSQRNSQYGTQSGSQYGTQRNSEYANQFGTVNSAFTQLTDDVDEETGTVQSAGGFTLMSQ